MARSLEPLTHAGCAGGWYAIRPRGFVCVGAEATLDLNHPTLAAMALAPNLEAPLPYTYARARAETPLFEQAPGQVDRVREVATVRRRAGMAVVGSWSAKEPSGSQARLALRTDGRFVRAADLEAAKPSDFAGVELGKRADLPLAFVVKRGVRSFRLNGAEAEKGDLIEYHSELPLSGRFRSVGSVKYWAFDGGALRASDAGQELWVRHQDVTVVQRRAAFPDFVKDDERWLDVSVTTATLVAYEGKRAVFATLLSVARELPEATDGTTPASGGPRPIPLGTTSVRQKALTFVGSTASGFDDADDVPWALELGSGQLIHGAYWHDRFGIEHGAGSFALSPSDAARLFRFVGPELPQGWHAVVAPPERATPVVIRK
ncbi:MAG TPA: L,D-transpeptidase [Polyangiaceae bacterium]|nr:L,D-transpeptidase [Polyangiaceae bacterium]